jgi:hypothetical protein
MLFLDVWGHKRYFFGGGVGALTQKSSVFRLCLTTLKRVDQIRSEDR